MTVKQVRHDREAGDGTVRASSWGLKTGEALERELGLSDRPRDDAPDQHPHECAC